MPFQAAVAVLFVVRLIDLKISELIYATVKSLVSHACVLRQLFVVALLIGYGKLGRLPD